MENLNISRRSLLTKISLAAAATIIPSALFGEGARAGAPENPRPDGKLITPEEALAYLVAGNKRVVKGYTTHKNYAPAGKVFTDGQWPFAAILGCSDSRVQHDEVFDVLPANLFSVRNAGNVVDEDVLGSLEYAVEHLSSSLIVVMGHSGCGAVKATEGVIASGKPAGGNIDALIGKIKPTLLALPKDHTLPQAVNANAHAGAAALISQSKLIEEAVKAGDLKIVSAAFDLKTKAVTWNV